MKTGSSSLMLTEANIKRLVGKLSQMRGAALKLGQFMSIQGMHLSLALAASHEMTYIAFFVLGCDDRHARSPT
jgi:predicted unusual protein kinase regulating ubiquinone biosynthesis (AarF/ABC1/UbiB family)